MPKTLVSTSSRIPKVYQSPNGYSILISDICGIGEFTNSVGLGFDASGLLGNTRSKRYVAVVEDGKVVNLQVRLTAP